VNVEGRAAVLKKYKDHFKKNLEICENVIYFYLDAVDKAINKASFVCFRI